MKRSELNEIIREGEKFIASFGFKLPEFATWSLDDWQQQQAPRRRGRSARGWAGTSPISAAAISRIPGLLLFTIRNGSQDNLKRGGGMVYAEKIMISRKNQITPMHTHGVKTEDIIVRGGAPLGGPALQRASRAAAPIDDKPGRVRMDGIDARGEGRRRGADPARQLHHAGAGPPPFLLGVRAAIAWWARCRSSMTTRPTTTSSTWSRAFPDVEEDEPPYRLIVPDYARL